MSSWSGEVGLEGEAGPVSRRLARWIAEFMAQTPPKETMDRAEGILLDSLGCAVAAHCDDTAAMVMRLAIEAGGRGDATIVGLKARLPLTPAGFVITALIRALDLSDAYSGPGLVGHPSDNLGYALSRLRICAPPRVRPLVRDPPHLRNLRADSSTGGFSIIGSRKRLLGITVRPRVSRRWRQAPGCYGLDEERMSNALALVASHSCVSREVRGASIPQGSRSQAPWSPRLLHSDSGSSAGRHGPRRVDRRDRVDSCA